MLNLTKYESLNSKIFNFYGKDYSNFLNFLTELQETFPNLIIKSQLNHFEVEFHVTQAQLIAVLTFLNKNAACAFKVLTDLVAVDSLDKNPDFRFSVLYSLLSIQENVRATVIVQTNDSVPSCTGLYSDAAWLEREVWDLFGIFFTNNKDLRRILTDYGFIGHPLRKDFPLSGFVEVFYEPLLNKVVYTPVSLAQEYRDFVFKNPWDLI